MLKEKGVSFDKIAQVFENIYNQTAQEVLNSDGMITGRGARGLSRKGHAYINVKKMCDTFVDKFNENIENAINEMNASQTDFDTIDLNLGASVLNKTEDENGNKTEIKDDAGNVINEDFAKAYASGKVLTTKKRGAEYYKPIAEQIINGLKSQILAKAKAMCTANGIEFNSSVFTTMFNNAKSIAVNAAVSGVTSKGAKVGNCVGAAGTTGAATVGTLVGTKVITTGMTTVAKAAGGHAFVETFMGAQVGAKLAAAIPGIGWAIAGASTLATAALLFFGSAKSSSSSLDTKSLVDTFTQNFKENYTNWVDEEKNKTKKS